MFPKNNVSDSDRRTGYEENYAEEITFVSITAKSVMISMQFTLNTIVSNAD